MADLITDIETGGLPLEILQESYEQPTFEEFAENCDKRWKPETVQEKYEKSKESAWNDFVDKAALNAHTAEVLAIGFMDCDTLKHGILKQSDKLNEAGLLVKFWTKYSECVKENRRMIGLNIFGFDLPMLVRRSMILGVEFPSSIRQQRRYWNSIFVDLRDDWILGQQFGQVKWSADFLARTLGVGAKTKAEIDGIEICGKNFGKLFRGSEDHRQAALDYLANDLKIECLIAKRLGVV